MALSQVERASPAVAANVISTWCEDDEAQRIVLGQLLRSVREAERVAPGSWAVTLKETGFRLNVGNTEVFNFEEGCVFVFLYRSIPAEVKEYEHLEASNLRTVGQPQYMFAGTVEELTHYRELLQEAHARFVCEAAHSPNGEPRTASNYARTHSPGLWSYAQTMVGAVSAGGAVCSQP